MTHLATVSPNFQISLPKALRERLGLQPGDQLVVEEQDGNLVLTPAVTLPKSQLYFWTRRWQKGERKAEEDLAAGRVSRSYKADEVDQMTTDILAEKPVRSEKP